MWYWSLLSKIIRNFCNEGGDRAKKQRNFRYPAHSYTGKVLLQINGNQLKLDSWQSQLTRYQEPPMGTPNPKNRFQEVNSSIISDVWYGYFSNPSKRYCLKTVLWHGRLELTLVANTALYLLLLSSSSSFVVDEWNSCRPVSLRDFLHFIHFYVVFSNIVAFYFIR